MRKIALFLSIAALAVLMMSCGGSAQKKGAKSESVEVAETAKVMVYYFHSKQRCKTCLAIQEIAEQTIADEFAKNADVNFVELDYTESANEAITNKYEVAGSSLIIVSGDTQKNLTSDAFANALKSPEVLMEIIVAEVNKHL